MRRPHEFADFKLIRAEIDEETVFQARGLKVAKNLGIVFAGQGLCSFQFDNQRIFNQ